VHIERVVHCANVHCVTDWFIRCSTARHQVMWESRSPHFRPQIDSELHITPHMMVGRMVLECMYGPERHSKQKNKRPVRFSIIKVENSIVLFVFYGDLHVASRRIQCFFIPPYFLLLLRKVTHSGQILHHNVIPALVSICGVMSMLISVLLVSVPRCLRYVFSGFTFYCTSCNMCCSQPITHRNGNIARSKSVTSSAVRRRFTYTNMFALRNML